MAVAAELESAVTRCGPPGSGVRLLRHIRVLTTGHEVSGDDGRSAKRHGSGIGEFPLDRVFVHCCLLATYMSAFGTKTTRRCHKVRTMISIRSVHRVGVSVDGHSFDPP
jgi:hypothetical protein